MAENKRKRVVVTGGAGFLGSHLCDAFLERDCDVICIDNFITGQRKNIAHLERESRFVCQEHDISLPIEIEGPVDYVLHFASPASPVDYMNHPIATLKVGAFGTYHALGLAKQKQATFLLASTSEVYGDPLVHPQPETYWGNVNPVGPRSVYDEAKRFAEAMTMAYYQAHDVDTRIVRIFNTYGPRMRLDDGRVVPTFIDQALKGKALTVFGDGSQTRSFCYVDDEVRGILSLLFSNQHQPVNIGNPNELSVLEFARHIIAATGTKSHIVCKPLPTDDPKIRRPDITKATTYLQWEPKVDLQEGLLRTIDWFGAEIKEGLYATT